MSRAPFAPVITPPPTTPVPVAALGLSKLGWLKKLKESALISILIPSINKNVLPMLRSRSRQLGPISVFRRMSPKVWGAGVANAAGLNHSLTDGLGTEALATWFGSHSNPQ